MFDFSTSSPNVVVCRCADREKEKLNSENRDKKNAEVCFFVTVGLSFCRVVNGWIKHIWKAMNMLSTI